MYEYSFIFSSINLIQVKKSIQKLDLNFPILQDRWGRKKIFVMI
jgi:hypothetical protein